MVSIKLKRQERGRVSLTWTCPICRAELESEGFFPVICKACSGVLPQMRGIFLNSLVRENFYFKWKSHPD